MKRIFLVAAALIIGAILYRGSSSTAVALKAEVAEAKALNQAIVSSEEVVSTPEPMEARVVGLEAISALVPTKEELVYERDLSDKFHQIPRLAQQGADEAVPHGLTNLELAEAEALADIREFSVAHPKFKSVTQKLYRSCSEDSALDETVRALCYFRTLELSLELNNSEEIVDLTLPENVKQLALKLGEK